MAAFQRDSHISQLDPLNVEEHICWQSLHIFEMQTHLLVYKIDRYRRYASKMHTIEIYACTPFDGERSFRVVLQKCSMLFRVERLVSRAHISVDFADVFRGVRYLCSLRSRWI